MLFDSYVRVYRCMQCVVMCIHLYVCILVYIVPKIFMESRVYAVSENIGAVNIGVSTNGQHLSPITFAVLFTNESAQGE